MQKVILKQGKTIEITAESGPAPETPIAFTAEQIRELIKISASIDQFDGSMADELTMAAAQNSDADWAMQGVIRCAAGGCVAGARYLELVSHWIHWMLVTELANRVYSFANWYSSAVESGMFVEKEGVWNWQANESMIYNGMPWPDINKTIINHYNMPSILPNVIDGMQYREFRRGEPYELDADIINAAMELMPSVLCFRDGPDKSGGTHTSVAVLYESTDGKHYYVMLDTAHREWRGTLLMLTEAERQEALESPDEFIWRRAAGPVRFGEGLRWLFNAYTHVSALSLLMRYFAMSVRA